MGEMTRCADTPLVASYYWPAQGRELHKAQAAAVESLGYRHILVGDQETLPKETGIVLVQGPYGSLLPLVSQLQAYPPEQRPVLAYWFQQSMRIPEPQALAEVAALSFSELQLSPAHTIARTVLRPVAKAARKANRLGYLGDILWLQHHGLLDLLVLSSTLYADYFERLGISSLLVPRGYHASYGRRLGTERDVAMVWMGKLRNRRRRGAVHWLRAELAQRGQELLVYDGEERDFIFGQKRTDILNRAFFVLNVVPDPTWEVSIRYYIAAACGAVILTEQNRNSYPFVPGEHLVERQIEEMPDAVTHYLNNQRAWQRIATNAHNLVTQNLTLERSLQTVLASAEAKLAERQARADTAVQPAVPAETGP